MRVLKITLAYDGTDFAGWQVQPGQRTVQGSLEVTLEKITSRSTRATASGRTDSGVHARGQVVSTRVESSLSCETLQRALNAELPNDMAVLRVEDAAADFHAIRDAQKKRYRYLIHNGPTVDVFRRHDTWHYPSPLRDAAMHRAAQALLGKHDFSSFETSGAERASSVRTILDLCVAREERPGELLAIEVEADGFLYNMVRTIVGTLVEVGRGARDEGWPAEVLAAVDRRVAGPTAPPQGLCLVRVDY